MVRRPARAARRAASPRSGRTARTRGSCTNCRCRSSVPHVRVRSHVGPIVAPSRAVFRWARAGAQRARTVSDTGLLQCLLRRRRNRGLPDRRMSALETNRGGCRRTALPTPIRSVRWCRDATRRQRTARGYDIAIFGPRSVSGLPAERDHVPRGEPHTSVRARARRSSHARYSSGAHRPRRNLNSNAGSIQLAPATPAFL